MADDDKTLAETQATRLKLLAETTYNTNPNSPTHLKSSLKYTTKAHNLYPSLPGLSSSLTAFKILNSISTTPNETLDYYSILGLTPFSPLNSIKTQFKKLALLLHPDKTRAAHAQHEGVCESACEEAFKVVNDAFRVLSDRGLRREYDTRLRLAMQSEMEEEEDEEEGEEDEEEGRSMFWAVCERCELMHEFKRKSVGRNVVCPDCDLVFRAFEVFDDGSVGRSGKNVGRKGGFREGLVNFEGNERGKLRRNEKKSAMVDEGSSKNMGRKGGFGGRLEDCEGSDMDVVLGKLARNERKIVKGNGGRERVSGGKFADLEGNGLEVGQGMSGKKDRKSDRVIEESLRNASLKGNKEVVDQGKSGNDVRRSTRVRVRKKYFWDDLGENVLTLEENDEGRSKVDDGNAINNGNKDRFGEERSRNGGRKRGRLEIVEEEGERELTLAEMRSKTMKKVNGKKKEGNRVKNREENEEVKKGRRLQVVMNGEDMKVMSVEDSDFYNFDKDRVERCFKKSQIWAIYDDDDGMPRHYGLIDEVVSFNPFEVKMSWLDLEKHGDDHLITWEKFGFRLSCGRFKVARKDTINLLNIFSHMVECERAARELYRIYPKKGSVWALYHEQELVIESGSFSGRGRRKYDIVVLLTSYSEMHGLSMAYLEKVDGFRAVFKRCEIGFHAIKWLEKDGVRLFSHQIPAKKLSRNDVPDLSCDCWELDPASLPSNLLAITKE